MYLRVTRRRNRDGSIAEYYQLAETRWDAAKRHPTAHIIHNSEGTVKNHLHNIYVKLKVSSRRKLLRWYEENRRGRPGRR